MTENLVIDNVAIPISIPFVVIDFDIPLDYYTFYCRTVVSKGGEPKTFQIYLMTVCKWLELHPEAVEVPKKNWFKVYIDHWGLTDFVRRCGGKSDDIELAEKMDLAKLVK